MEPHNTHSYMEEKVREIRERQRERDGLGGRGGEQKMRRERIIHHPHTQSGRTEDGENRLNHIKKKKGNEKWEVACTLKKNEANATQVALAMEEDA